MAVYTTVFPEFENANQELNSVAECTKAEHFFGLSQVIDEAWAHKSGDIQLRNWPFRVCDTLLTKARSRTLSLVSNGRLMSDGWLSASRRIATAFASIFGLELPLWMRRPSCRSRPRQGSAVLRALAITTHNRVKVHIGSSFR